MTNDVSQIWSRAVVGARHGEQSRIYRHRLMADCAQVNVAAVRQQAYRRLSSSCLDPGHCSGEPISRIQSIKSPTDANLLPLHHKVAVSLFISGRGTCQWGTSNRVKKTLKYSDYIVVQSAPIILPEVLLVKYFYTPTEEAGHMLGQSINAIIQHHTHMTS
jgi:hypothetical protein